MDKPVHYDGSLHNEEVMMEEVEVNVTEEARRNISGNPYLNQEKQQ
ncbi:hypothetical protein ACFFGV_18455 [Pontibacillus salicampi]|uniref:DUF4021 domain-containing protein n=1 Tax=Pontibacillus salicampi TaxID=1449801 RepID=A0ABV6LTJ5_9BACI